MQTYPLRLSPGDDLRGSIEDALRRRKWPAAFVLQGIGPEIKEITSSMHRTWPWPCNRHSRSYPFPRKSEPPTQRSHSSTMSTQKAIPDQEAWNAWQPAELARRLIDIHLPWCVVGGWALDLWHGAQTRRHDDLEFTILRENFGTFRQAFGDLAFYTAHAGVVEKLPEDQVAPSEVMQFWGYDRAAESWRVDMMIEPGTHESWAYKRDPTFKRPRAEMVMSTVDGIPYLNPSAVLLFKASRISREHYRNCRPSNARG